MAEKRIIRVFIASPGDLAIERRALKDTIDELNRGFGRGADVEFVPLGWEDALSQVGRRSQAVINQDVDACDVFVLVMWRRWGQDAPDAAPCSSYTEEEFYRALARWERAKSPTIFVFFKYVEPGQMADPGPQLAKVLEFRRKLEQTRKVLYREFKDDGALKIEIDRHLVAYARSEISPSDELVRVPMLPDSVCLEIERHKSEARGAAQELEKLRAVAKHAQDEAERARAEAKNAVDRAEAAERFAEAHLECRSIDFAERASNAALAGRIEEARQEFAKALDGTRNLGVIYLGFEFYHRIGDLKEAERLLMQWSSISGPEGEPADTASAYGNLGAVALTRGDVDASEEYYKKALAIVKGCETAETEEIVARTYANLGVIELTRDDLGGAERYYKNAIEISERLGLQELTARAFGNLANVAAARGEFDSAEDYLGKSLEIHEALGLRDDIARDYGNLGLIHQSRGELYEAKMCFVKAIDIQEELGIQEDIARTYCNLGTMEHQCGNLEAAESHQRKVLLINERIGRVEGMAAAYSNLGHIAEAHCKIAEARELWTMARDIYQRLGAKARVAKAQSWLDSLPPDPPSTLPSPENK